MRVRLKSERAPAKTSIYSIVDAETDEELRGVMEAKLHVTPTTSQLILVIADFDIDIEEEVEIERIKL